MTTPSRRITPTIIRPRLMLEAASEMMGADGWPFLRARLTLDAPGGVSEGVFSLIGTQDPAVIAEVARGEVHAAMLNPSAMLTLAVRGTGPFAEPQPLAAIGVIPSDDQLAFAVTAASGVTSLAEIAERKTPLRVSVRGSHDPSTALLANEVLKAYGFDLDDIGRWGGHVSYDQPLPNHPTRLGAVERGEVDAIFDEAVNTWVNRAAAMGMRFLPVDGEPMTRLAADGFRPGVLQAKRFPDLRGDVPTVDFSGWPIYTGAQAPDMFVTAFCKALEARKDRIPWESSGKLPLPLERMCHDAPDAPLDVPLHPAAERFWQECGYLTRSG